jgi:Zn-dependent peptidase ImmA (M78 family)
LEIRVARFLSAPITVIKDPNAPLQAPAYEGAKLRRIRDIDGSRLAPAIHASIQIAGAVIRSLKADTPDIAPLPVDGVAWRGEIGRDRPQVELEDILRDLWRRGIPVVPLETLPEPNFQAVACIAEGRPVILLAHKYDSPGRVAFLTSHEAGHVANGDCALGEPVVDMDDENDDADVIEVRADRFASGVLFGSGGIPEIQATEPRAIAKEASQLEKTHGIDAGALVYRSVKNYGYQTARQAVVALYRDAGARDLVLKYLNSFLDYETASESDKALLGCIYKKPDDAPAH